MTSTLLADPDVKDAIALMATYGIREGIVDRRLPSFGNTLAIGGAQLAYNKFVRSYILGLAGQATGEKYWSSLLANAAGLSVVLYGLKSVDIISGASEDIGDAALLPSPSGKWLSSISEAGELLLEKQVLEYLLSSCGMMPPMLGNQPAPAKVITAATL